LGYYLKIDFFLLTSFSYLLFFFKAFGRNLTIVRFPNFIKLVRIGLPAHLRGEMWELCSGAIYKRYMMDGYYEKLHRDNAGKVSLSTEEIEKDLNRLSINPF